MNSVRFIYAAAIFLLFFSDISGNQDDFQTFHSEPALDEALCDMNALDNIPSVSVISCMTECSTNAQCLSFSFSKGERMCWLHTIVVSAGATGQPNAGAQCYNMMHDVCDVSSGYTYEAPLNFCFKEYSVVADYNAAKATCLQDRAYLVRVDNFNIWGYLGALQIQDRYFIQSNYNTSAAEWQFDDQTNIAMSTWLPPGDIHTASNKIVLDKYMFAWTPETTLKDVCVCQKLTKHHQATVAPTTPVVKIGIMNIGITKSPIGTASTTHFSQSSLPPT